MRKRVFFNKFSSMKFISHLDTLRLMDRLFKISGVELEYTQGFHPRPKMSFGNPISLGEEAFNEPMDVVTVDDNLSNDEILQKLNSSSPDGMEFVKIEDLAKKSNISADYNVLNYELTIDYHKDFDALIQLLIQDEIVEVKEKKGKIKKRDLKARIKSCKFLYREQKVIMGLENMSPNAFLKLCNIEAAGVDIKRLGYEKVLEKTEE